MHNQVMSTINLFWMHLERYHSPQDFCDKYSLCMLIIYDDSTIEVKGSPQDEELHHDKEDDVSEDEENVKVCYVEIEEKEVHKEKPNPTLQLQNFVLDQKEA